MYLSSLKLELYYKYLFINPIKRGRSGRSFLKSTELTRQELTSETQTDNK